jgi:hypothetical protein
MHYFLQRNLLNHSGYCICHQLENEADLQLPSEGIYGIRVILGVNGYYNPERH